MAGVLVLTYNWRRLGLWGQSSESWKAGLPRGAQQTILVVAQTVARELHAESELAGGDSNWRNLEVWR